MVSLGCAIFFALVAQVLSEGCNKSEIANDTHGYLEFRFADNDTVPNGGSVSVRCSTPGYESSGGTGRTIRCLNDSWQGELHTCQPAKCPIKHLSNVLSDLDHGTFKFEPELETDEEAAKNGTIVSGVCDTGYQMIKKKGEGQYGDAEYSDNDAFFCHYSVWVGRKPTDLGYQCVPTIGQVLIIGGIADDAGKTIELYDTKNPGNNKVLGIQLSGNQYGHTSGIFDNGIIVISGGLKTGGEHTSDTEFYDPIHNKTFPGPPMIEIRGYAGSAMVDNEMIVCGGHNKINNSTILETCEKLSYNEATGNFSNWTSFEPIMDTPRYSHAMTQYNKDLFVIGGFDSGVMADTASHYNHTANTWSSIDPMGIIRTQLAAAQLGGLIYACGGGHGQSPMELCQKYDPESATWSNATSMNTATLGLAMISVDGKLYSFTNSPDGIVEYYDPTSNNWTIAEPMKKVRSYAEVVQLKSYLQYLF